MPLCVSVIDVPCYFCVRNTNVMTTVSETQQKLWTIGHSQHTLEVFMNLLNTYGIVHVADIRSFPGSQRYPHFNREVFVKALQAAGIAYTHFPELGGKSISGVMQQYASDHSGVQRLMALARGQRVVYLCAEADWRHCHRARLSDYFHCAGWHVVHIKANGGSEKHPLVVRQASLF